MLPSVHLLARRFKVSWTKPPRRVTRAPKDKVFKAKNPLPWTTTPLEKAVVLDDGSVFVALRHELLPDFGNIESVVKENMENTKKAIETKSASTAITSWQSDERQSSLRAAIDRITQNVLQKHDELAERAPLTQTLASDQHFTEKWVQGESSRNKRIFISAEEAHQMALMRAQGASAAELCKTFNCTMRVVQRHALASPEKRQEERQRQEALLCVPKYAYRRELRTVRERVLDEAYLSMSRC